MRSIIIGIVGGIGAFAASWAGVLLLQAPDASLPASPRADPGEQAVVCAELPAAERVPLQVGPAARPADPAPTAESVHVAPVPEEIVAVEECREPEPVLDPAPPPPVAAVGLVPVVAPVVTPAAVPQVPAKFAAAAEALRNFRLSVPPMKPVARVVEPLPASVREPSPATAASPAAARAAVAQPAPAERPAPPKIIARTSTIPKRPHRPQGTASPMLPEVDGSALLRASDAIDRLSRRLRSGNVG